MHSVLGNTGTFFDGVSQFLFGGPAEVGVSEAIILNEIYGYMTKKGFKTE